MGKKTEVEAVGEQPIVAVQSEQSLEPNFDVLSVSEHHITKTAEGQDAETRRGRPRMTDEERAAARERKKQADRDRKSPGKKTAGEKQAAQVDEKMGAAKANAAMVVAGLEMLCKAISNGEHQTSKEQMVATHGAWSVFLYEQDIVMPAWLAVTIISAAHVAPAFNTQAGKGKLETMWIKAKAWWQLRKGK